MIYIFLLAGVSPISALSRFPALPLVQLTGEICLPSFPLSLLTICYQQHGDPESHRITEYPELEVTHQDHCVQLLALHRTLQQSLCASEHCPNAS